MKSFKLIACIFMNISYLVQIKRAETIDVTYEDLKELNATCFPDDSCSASDPQYWDTTAATECYCGMFCAQYGACCVDSPYKNIPAPRIKPTCRALDASMIVYGYLMIDQCPQTEDSQSVYKDLCRDEWGGENDIMRLLPVTSLFTHITYKNYYCFRCHENNDDFVYWNIRINYEGQSSVNETTRVHLEFDKHRNSWVAPLGQSGELIPVSFPAFYIPIGISALLKTCNLGVISNCSEYWEDDTVRAKCGAYMAVMFISREGAPFLLYRNPHCAICNFEDLNNLICKSKLPMGGGSGGEKTSFSFALLLDINRSDGEKVGKIEKCSNNEIWDPFFKKCKTLTCALPGYVVKDGECTAP